MKKGIVFFFVVMAVLGALVYGYFLYKRSSIIREVKDNIRTSLETANIVAKKIEIPPNKVSVSMWKLMSGKSLDISAGDLLITMVTEGSEGKITIGKLSLKYPALKKQPMELCEIKNTKVSFTTPEIIMSGSIKITSFSPCMKLDQKPHPLKGRYENLTLLVKQKTNPAKTLMNMKCRSVHYSQEGYLDKAPIPSPGTDFKIYTEKVERWYKSKGKVGIPLWKVSTTLTDFDFLVKNAGDEMALSMDRSSFSFGLNLSNKKSLNAKIQYGLNNLKVNNRKLAISWQLIGLQPTSIFPLNLKTVLNVQNVPSELLGASLYFMHSMGKNEISPEYTTQVFSSLLGIILKEAYPFSLHVNLDVSSGASARATLEGKAGFARINANGTISLESINVIVGQLSQIARSNFEKTIADKLTCDPDYKKCTGEFVIRNGKVDFIQKW